MRNLVSSQNKRKGKKKLL